MYVVAFLILKVNKKRKKTHKKKKKIPAKRFEPMSETQRIERFSYERR